MLTGAALTQLSCSVLVDSNRVQCLTDGDCQAHGFVDAVCDDTAVCRPNPTWACLGQVSWAAPTETRKVTVTIHIADLITEQPTPGVSARLCRKVDVMCTQPLGPDVTGDQDGNIIMSVDLGFDGYVELRAKDKMPGMYFFYPPIDGDREVPFVPLFDVVGLARFAAVNNKSIVADRGHVLLGTYDCTHKLAEGVRLSTPNADAETSPFYVLQKIPTTVATATDSSRRYRRSIECQPQSGELGASAIVGAESVRDGSSLNPSRTLPAPKIDRR